MAGPRFHRINPLDDVAVAIDSAPVGSRVAVAEHRVTLREDLAAGQKVALRNIDIGERILKYGFPIGRAIARIPAGSWVHTHNLETLLCESDAYVYRGRTDLPASVPSSTPVPVFSGYRRPDGSVGTRNEVWILPTVGCVNGIAQRVSQIATERLRGRFGGLAAPVCGVFAFPHPYGCSQLGADLLTTQTVLAGLVKHPNAGGVLVLGLGCENNKLDAFKRIVGTSNPARVMYLAAQDVEDELRSAVDAVDALIDYAAAFHREPVPVSELTVGLKCGGSDGFSGITANPLVGSFSDRLTEYGGTTILTEVPEMFGAETILMDRAIDRNVFDATVVMIDDFKKYFIRHGQAVYENPSPGNKDGGITTLEEKSLGSVQKGGRATVWGVHRYGDRVGHGGLRLLSGPGNDIVSLTALTAAGAQLVLFTTGRGTPLGGPVPTVKIASNADLTRRKSSWIDFNAGTLLDAPDLMAVRAVEAALFDRVLEIASGSPTRNEVNGYREIAIFKDGVTL